MGSLAISWTPPQGFESRPVAVLGAGVLGRRIASCWAAAGYAVHIRDPDVKQREEGVQYVEENLPIYQEPARKATPGKIHAFEELKAAVETAWIVFECVPEKLQLKIDTFAELEALAPADCIFATNSSSYKSSEMLEKISDAAKVRVLNTHYFMPPKIMATELMTDGYTSPGIFAFLEERFGEAGLKPYVARKESTGFIFNRLWAAVKRELLTILSEDVADVPTLDAIYSDVILSGQYPPFKLMDVTGLDTIAFIEEHYIKERKLPSTHLDYLRKNYIAQGKLGCKSPRGGFYPPSSTTTTTTTPQPRHILALDLGFSSPTHPLSNGALLSISAGPPPTARPLLSALALPDGLALCPRTHRLFFTTMGTLGAADGALWTATLPALADVRALIAPASRALHTPKQVCVDAAARRVYVCDREGMAVVRCGYDGEGVEAVVRTGDGEDEAQRGEQERWCVGVAVARAVGRVFWSQKGASKSGRGRIMGMRLEGEGKGEVEVVLEGLPEPIDLEWVESGDGEEGGWLYWTDRGELPFGNTLNVVKVDGEGRVVVEDGAKGPLKHRILATKFHEAIGLKVDVANRHVYVADLGGAIYRCNLDSSGKTKVYEDETRAFSGIAIL